MIMYNEKEPHFEKKMHEPFIIHGVSGGIWSGIRLNGVVQHKGVIMEAGPFELDNKVFIKTVENVYKIKLHPMLHSHVETCMELIDVPTPSHT